MTANAVLGTITPKQLDDLTIPELDHMIAGAQQRTLSNQQFNFTLTQVGRPAIMVDKDDNAAKVSAILQQQQNDIDNFGNEEYRRRQIAKKKRQAQFASVFGKFSRQNQEKKGG